jgi:hypothetical protein
MIQEKRMKLLQKSASKVIKLSDGRWGIIFQNKRNADIFANFLRHSKLNPTQIHQTKYGYAFKYDDVSSIKDDVWPNGLIPPKYNVEIHGTVYLEWDNLNYVNYMPSLKKVFIEEYQRIGGGGIHMKNLKVPYPVDFFATDKKKEGIPVMTTVKPNGWITHTHIPQYKFTSYIWYLNPVTGRWTMKQTKGLRPMKGDKIGDFITKEVQAGKITHRSD